MEIQWADACKRCRQFDATTAAATATLATAVQKGERHPFSVVGSRGRHSGHVAAHRLQAILRRKQSVRSANATAAPAAAEHRQRHQAANHSADTDAVNAPAIWPIDATFDGRPATANAAASNVQSLVGRTKYAARANEQ